MRMRYRTREILTNMRGLIQPDEAMRLAELAAQVPEWHAIVEIGAHTGLSTCWMACGAAGGRGAHVTTIDPWPMPRPDSKDDPFGLGPDGVMHEFAHNLSSVGMWPWVTVLRSTAVEIAPLWIQSVGLLFDDAVHTAEAVTANYEAWCRHFVSGTVLALHDYIEDPEHPYYGVSVAARDVILASGEWDPPTVTGYLWTARHR